VRLSADYQRLEFLRVLRAHPHEVIEDPGGLLTPGAEFFGPAALPVTPQPQPLDDLNDG
jgi:rod shape-determining protein MreC